jgi:hypothetical protein
VFAPLVPFDAYTSRLRRLPNLAADQIDRKIDAIKKQRVSSLFFLPRGGKLDNEYIAILDDLHTIPRNTFVAELKRSKLFSLGQMGFYLFLLKLSIHFCRFQEGVVRDTSC